jgi:class 3 adenylate cyclase
MKALLGTTDEEELGLGRHLIEAQLRPPWRRTISERTEIEHFQMQAPLMIEGTPGGRERLKEMLPELVHPWLEELKPAPLPPLWTSKIEFVQGELPPVPVRVLDVRLGTERERIGVLRVYGSALPARVLALVGRGDEGMFTRMARIFEPSQREAAILFADLESSGALSRKLPSAAFFNLIRDLTTEIDGLVVANSGIVGKHAGDGVTAFFLAEDLGSRSAAAQSAIEVGRAIADKAAAVAERQSKGRRPLDCRFNVGLHWGEQLYMGQVVTGGRIEVTALGDEVNEGARIEQTARQGQVLASKRLIERLGREDAAALGLDPDLLMYRPIAELNDASPKAIRDAGGVAVADVRLKPG